LPFGEKRKGRDEIRRVQMIGDGDGPLEACLTGEVGNVNEDAV
jgi:hypothetical protein